MSKKKTSQPVSLSDDELQQFLEDLNNLMQKYEKKAEMDDILMHLFSYVCMMISETGPSEEDACEFLHGAVDSFFEDMEDMEDMEDLDTELPDDASINIK